MCAMCCVAWKMRLRLRCVGCGKFGSQDGYTALIEAAWEGHAGCVRLLIDAGADKEAKNNVRRRSLLC